MDAKTNAMTVDRTPTMSPAPVGGCICALAAAVAIAVGAAGCDDTPTRARVSNGYPTGGGDAAAASSSATVVVYRAWWVTTLFRDPIAAGAISEVERSVPATDYAFALIAPGGSPSSSAPPGRLIALKSAQPLSAARGDLLTIAVSDTSFVGDCAQGPPLGDDDARLITERIFPGDFAGNRYDPTTCTTTPLNSDAGASDDGGDADPDGR